MKACITFALLALGAARVPAGAAAWDHPSAPPLRVQPLAAAGQPAPSSLTRLSAPDVERLVWRPCSLETPAPLVFPPPAPAPVYLSLGGPWSTRPSFEALPGLPDEPGASDQDGTLRLFRSRW